MFVNFIDGNEKEDLVRRMLPPQKFPHEIFSPLVSLTIVVSEKGGLMPPPPPYPSISNSSCWPIALLKTEYLFAITTSPS